MEYGADLHTMDHGSGFPTIITDDEMLTCELEYAQSPWNLNKLPVLEGSVLQYIDSDISGMKVTKIFNPSLEATAKLVLEIHFIPY